MFTDRLTVEYGDLTEYIKEDTKIADNFLQTYFYDDWKYDGKKGEVRTSIELIISPKCNQACKYCYWVHHLKDLFPDKYYDEENIKKNLLLLLKWLDKNQYNPDIEIFSGEIFALQIGYDCLNIIYEYEKNVDVRWRIPSVMIPTNFSFVNNDELVDKVKSLKALYDEINIKFFISSSFDGKYEEVNRPYTKDLDLTIGKPALDDQYYDKMFALVKELNAGLHPMVYSEHIEQWKDNFIWFQNMMEKHEIPWESLYLLEVRNDNWDQKSILAMQDFIRFLFDWVYKKFDGDKQKFFNFIFHDGFNLLTECISRVPRGMPCSIQSTWFIRLSDLECYPCHRQGYDHLHYGHYEITNDDEILRFVPVNVPLLLAIYGLHHRNFNYCAECPINHLCIGPCLGANYEANHNIMTPALTVCALKHGMVTVFIEMLIKYDIYYDLLSKISRILREQMEWVRKEIKIKNDKL